MSIMSWSVPMTVDSHLQRRSRKGDGCNRVEARDDEGDGTADIDGGLGVLDKSAVVDIVDGALQRKNEKCSDGGKVLVLGSGLPPP